MVDGNGKTLKQFVDMILINSLSFWRI